MKKQILLRLASVLFTVDLYSQIDSVFSKKPLEEQINIIKSELIKDTIEFDTSCNWNSKLGWLW